MMELPRNTMLYPWLQHQAGKIKEAADSGRAFKTDKDRSVRYIENRKRHSVPNIIYDQEDRKGFE